MTMIKYLWTNTDHIKYVQSIFEGESIYTYRNKTNVSTFLCLNGKIIENEYFLLFAYTLLLNFLTKYFIYAIRKKITKIIN